MCAGFWTVRARTWQFKEPKPTPPPKPEPPKPPEPKPFYYRRKYDSALGELTPYSPHSIVLGSHVYPTAAHLYWSIAFAKHPHIVKAIRDLRAVSDNDESVGKLLYIAKECKGLMRTEFEFIAKRKEIMLGVLLLKLCQHETIQKALADTGDAPLMYTQIPTPGQAKNDKLLDAVAGKIFGEKDAKGQRVNWGSLLHPDDAFWGVEPILDPKGGTSNHLGKILVDLRKRFKENKDATIAVSQTMAVMLSSLLNVPAVAPPPSRPPLLPPQPWLWPISVPRRRRQGPTYPGCPGTGCGTCPYLHPVGGGCPYNPPRRAPSLPPPGHAFIAAGWDKPLPSTKDGIDELLRRSRIIRGRGQYLHDIYH